VRTNTDCTLYAKTIVNGAEVYTRSVILAVMWENRKAANVIRSGPIEADAVRVFIPFARGALSFKAGDVLVKGVVTDTVGTGFTLSALKAKYANAVTVRSVDTMDYGSPALQHWQIGAS